MTDQEKLLAQAEQVAAQLAGLAEVLAANGELVASGVVLAGRQTIRALYTKLAPPPATKEAATEP